MKITTPKELQYLLSMGPFQKLENLRFEDHTYLFPFLPAREEFGKTFSALSSRFFITIRYLTSLIPYPSYIQNEQFGPLWVWTNSSTDGKMNLI
jgi:hypothetical protein